MVAKIIDGSAVAKLHRERIREDVASWTASGNRAPFLATVLVGADPASRSYVNAKARACADVGIKTHSLFLPDTISNRSLVEEIARLNADPSVDGIIVQVPLPGHLSSHDVIDAIDYRKDVDGFHPMNVGRLTVGEPCLRSCTPQGIVEVLRHYSIRTKGRHVVVVGASHIVGRPISILLNNEQGEGKATVTVCHKFTRDITRHTINADILIVAAGQPNFVRGEMVKKGAAVVDVGINRVASDTPAGYCLVGDCHFDSVADKAGWITPVPGGVGPMTVAMLMRNTLLAARRSIYPAAVSA